MRRKRELGYCHVSTENGTGWYLQRDQFSSVRTAWLKGAQSVDTIGFYGDRLTIKLAKVDGIRDVSPEVEMFAVQERRADEADDNLAGATA